MKFSTSVSLINRNTGHKPIHKYMGQTKVDKSNNYTLINFPWVLHPTGNPQDKKVWVPLRVLRDDLFTCVALHHRGTHAISTAS